MIKIAADTYALDTVIELRDFLLNSSSSIRDIRSANVRFNSTKELLLRKSNAHFYCLELRLVIREKEFIFVFDVSPKKVLTILRFSGFELTPKHKERILNKSAYKIHFWKP